MPFKRFKAWLCTWLPEI